MTFLLLKTRTAKKSHQCIWCPERIGPGEKYIDERSVWCGDFQALKFHPECKTACSEVARECGDFDIEPHGYKRGSTDERK